MKGCNLPEQVATGFSEVIGAMVGASYVPVPVRGYASGSWHEPYADLQATLAAQDASEHMVKMVLNQNCGDGSIVGQWSAVSIEQIV